MSLKDTLNADIKAALKGGDKHRTVILRMVTAAIKQREVDERIDLDDAEITRVIDKMVKQRRESEQAYRDGDRTDLAAKEAAEIDVLKSYLPEPLSVAELDDLIDAALRESGASSMREMGQAMAIIKRQAAGRVDMADVSKKLKAKLS